MDSTRTSPARWPVVVIAVAFFSCTTTYAQEASHDPLEDLNRSLQRLVEKVAPAIVEIETVGYGRPDGDEQSDTRVVAKTENQASGVILDADGYVITNAHVVAGAKRIKVILDDNSRTSQAAGSQRKSQFSARMVGSFEEVDLALLKV